MANEIRKQLTLFDRTAESVAFSRPRRHRGRSGARTSPWSGLRHRGQATSTPPRTLRGLRYLAERLDDHSVRRAAAAAPEATPFDPTLAALPVLTFLGRLTLRTNRGTSASAASVERAFAIYPDGPHHRERDCGAAAANLRRS